VKTFPKSTEQIQDIVAALLVEGTGVTLAYNDGAGTLTISSSVDLTGYATTAYVDDEVSANGVSLQAYASNASNLSSGTVSDARLSANVTLLGNTTTGTGSIARATSPTLTTPVLGAASATTLGVGTTSPAALPGYSTGIEVRNTATSLPSIRVSNATRYCGLGVDGTNATFSTNGVQFIIATSAGIGLSSGADRRLWVNNVQNTTKTTSQLEVVSQVTSFVIASFCGAVSQTGDYIRCVDASNNVLFSVGATGNLTANNLTMSGSYCPGQFTVATLPSAAANTGRTVQVTDSSVDFPGNIGNTVAGGGANNVDVKSNGTNWRITG